MTTKIFDKKMCETVEIYLNLSIQSLPKTINSSSWASESFCSCKLQLLSFASSEHPKFEVLWNLKSCERLLEEA